MPIPMLGKGWKPDLPDHRDQLYTTPSVVRHLPASVSLRLSPFMPPIWNQGEIGSCTAHGVGRCVMFDRAMQGLTPFMISRLFLYYQERVLERSVNSDDGAEIRDGIKVVSKFGLPDEALWPYIEKNFASHPPNVAYAEAIKHTAVSYKRIPRVLSQMKGCLASGFPFALGVTLYESFESDAVAANGIVPLPRSNEQTIGGHCMCATGYDDATQLFEVANSWDTDWGDKGYCYLPYAYLLDPNLGDDYWSMRVMK